jgi:hypothetical protein
MKKMFTVEGRGLLLIHPDSCQYEEPLICGIMITSMTSDVVVSCMWESVSTDSNEYRGVDVGA